MRYGFWTLFLCAFVLTGSKHALAQPALPDNFRQLKLYELDRACDALEPQGFTAAQRADAFVDWMSANDWQSDELNDQYNLFDWVRASTVDATHFSARWTGELTPPVTGAYTLRQLPVYRGLNSKLQVYVGEQLVLDSSGAQENADQLTGRPFQLSANQAVPLRVELVHDVNQITTFGESAPMCVLTWKTQEHGEALIPSSALSPPEGFGNGGHGLKGEYFGSTKFENLRGTRLDATLGFDWWWQPVIATHEPEAHAVLNSCKTKLLSGEYLSSAASEGKSFIYNYDMRLIAHRLSAAERLQVVNLLNGKLDVLAKMSLEGISRLVPAVYMLPGNEHLDLIGKWSLAHPQPRCEAGFFPGWGPGFYQQLNTDFYWLIARYMQGPYADDADILCDRYLERDNGDCNLAVAYVGAYASQLNGTAEKFVHRLDERIDDQSVQGDKLVTWLIARAFAKGAVPGRLEPLAGYSDLESAVVAAESNASKFWILQEMAARLASTNKTAQFRQLIEERRAQFTAPEQQQAIATWIAKADQLSVKYAEQPAIQKQAAKDARVAELTRRRQAAIDRGNEVAANRFSQLITATQNASEQ